MLSGDMIRFGNSNVVNLFVGLVKFSLRYTDDHHFEIVYFFFVNEIVY